MIYVGIDPGKKGGIAIITTKYFSVEAEVYPYSEDQLRKVINWYQDGECQWWIEKVHSMPHQGVKSTFNFGVNYGIILGSIMMKHTFYNTAPPSIWKKELGVTSDKATSIAKAKELFPEVNLIPGRCRTEQDGMAEALLIAEYGRRQHEKDTNIIC